MSLASRVLVLGVILVAGACETSPTGPHVFGDEGLKVTVTEVGLTLSNESGGTVRYIALEGRLAMRANWCLCAGAPTLKPGSQVTLAYSTISGYEPGVSTTVLVYWGVETSADQRSIDQEHIKVVAAKL